MFGIYMVVADYMKKAGEEITEQIKIVKLIKREMDRNEKIYKEEVKKFLGVRK